VVADPEIHAMNDAERCTLADADRCPVCGGSLVERRLKKHCTQCGTLCETCCDNGKE
jgi:hypothetical protein